MAAGEAPEPPKQRVFSRFEKAFIRVQTVMLAMTAQTPPKWVQNSMFYNILNTFSPPGCLRYIVFYRVLLHISESRPSAPKTPRDSPRTSARPPRDAPRTPQDPPRTPPEPPKLVVFRVPKKLCKGLVDKFPRNLIKMQEISQNFDKFLGDLTDFLEM